MYEFLVQLAAVCVPGSRNRHVNRHVNPSLKEASRPQLCWFLAMLGFCLFVLRESFLWCFIKPRGIEQGREAEQAAFQLAPFRALELSGGPPLQAVSVDPQPRLAAQDVFTAGTALRACLWGQARKPVLDFWL